MGSVLLKRRFCASLAAVLLVSAPALGDDPAWSGAGPFPPGNGSSRINSLLLDAATGTLYAGAGSGTVFSLSDSSLSKPPVALNDSVATYENTAVTIDILDNDSDPEGVLDPGSVVIKSQATNGTAAVKADGTVTYTPAGGYIGADSFSYTVSDAAGVRSNVATVVVKVQTEPGGDHGVGDDNGSGGDSTGDPGGGTTGGAAITSGGSGAWGFLGWLLALPSLWSRRRRHRREGDTDWPPRRR